MYIRELVTHKRAAQASCMHFPQIVSGVLLILAYYTMFLQMNLTWAVSIVDINNHNPSPITHAQT